MEAGTLVEWKIRPGDVVKRGDIIASVETQKGLIDVEVFEDGVVERLLVNPGTTVPIGTVLARIEGEQKSRTAPPESADTAGASPEPRRRAPPAMSSARDLRASPAAKVRARELGVPLDEIRGTGPARSITRGDVERAASAASPTAAVTGREGMRDAIAAAMTRSKREIPHYYLSTGIDVSRALEWLRERNATRNPEERIFPLAIFLKAIARAVHEVPEVNGYFEQGRFRPSSSVHLGVAISLREGGLVAPALHDVDTKTVPSIGAELADLIERARRGKLKSSELSDATLTVSSMGERGVEEVFGVIFPPQVALVGLGKISAAPAIVDGQCVARQTLVATLAADHRVSDGHRGGIFVSQVGALLQRVEEL